MNPGDIIGCILTVLLISGSLFLFGALIIILVEAIKQPRNRTEKINSKHFGARSGRTIPVQPGRERSVHRGCEMGHTPKRKTEVEQS